MSGCGENSTTQAADCYERARKLYRYVSDVARRIDEETAACKSIPNLFHTNIEVQRQKLRDNCEKLMFLDPLNYGKRALELLWRKVYYDTVSTAKKLQNLDEDYDNFLFTHIMCGIGQFHQMITKIQSESKVQFKELDYVSLQKEEEFEGVSTLHGDLEQWARSAIHSCLIYLGDLSRYQAEIFHTFDPSIAARYYLQAAHINFSSGMPYNQLGNLYMDKSHNLNSVCYYIHCLSCTLPFEGAMGNLTKLFEKNSQLIETFKSIEAVDLTQVEHIQGAVSNFLSLIEIWYLGKEDPDIPQRCNMLAQDLKVALNLTKIPLPDINKNYDEYVQATEDENINPSYINTNMMQEIVQICIFTVAKVSETDDKRAFGAKAFTLAVLSQLLQKLLQQLQQCGFKNPAAKYQKRYMSVQVEEITEPPKEEVECTNESSVMNGDADGCKETSIEINDEPIEINEEIVPEIVENGEIKNVKKNSTKRRRRRRVMSSSSSEVTDSDTDISDDAEHVSSNEEGNNSDSTAHSDCRSEHSDDDFSETESVADVELNGTNEELNNNNKKTDLQNGEPIKNSLEDNAIDDSDSLNINEIQNFLRGNNFLPSIKLLQDWILQEKDLILSCGESGESLFQCIVDLLNILEFYFKPKHSNDLPENCKILDYARCVAKSLELDYRRIPLPEDVSLRGTNICKFDTHAAEWNVLNQYQPSVYEENVLRILNFIDFGHQIAKIVPRIRYNRTLQIFYLKKITAPKLNTKLTHKRSREWHYSKMHVESKVKEGGLLRRLGRLWLASRVSELEKSGHTASPTLLALDAAALNLHLRKVKQLLRTRTFIVLIPATVLQELDDVKRDQITARDAIRWLETQLQTGSQYLRAQKPGQSRVLPLLKYPRKAPQNIHNFIQILEFCYHFVAEEKPHGGNGDVVDNNSKTAPMLVILTGNEPAALEEYKEFSLTAAAKSAGISVDCIDHFYAKWRQNNQKSGKKR